jgi:ATP-dependent Clp protease adaptor protein ClpS
VVPTYHWARTVILNKIEVIRHSRTVSQGSDEPTEEDYGDVDGLVLEETKPKLKRPPLYKVLLLNDDYTPMDFVVGILQGYFMLSQEQSVQVMLNVHQRGVGVCGVYPREIAETKVDQVMQAARENQHPLQCVMEPESDDGEEN